MLLQNSCTNIPRVPLWKIQEPTSPEVFKTGTPKGRKVGMSFQFSSFRKKSQFRLWSCDPTENLRSMLKLSLIGKHFIDTISKWNLCSNVSAQRIKEGGVTQATKQQSNENGAKKAKSPRERARKGKCEQCTDLLCTARHLFQAATPDTTPTGLPYKVTVKARLWVQLEYSRIMALCTSPGNSPCGLKVKLILRTDLTVHQI